MKKGMVLFIVMLNIVSIAFGTDYYSRQWYLENNGTYGAEDCDVDAEDAWAFTKGDTSVTIAVLDSGVPMDSNKTGWHYHPDLDDFGRVILGPDVWGELRDEDRPDLVQDNVGHGSAVAGIVGGQRNEPDDSGIRGIASGCKILIVKVAYSEWPQSDPEDFYNGVVAACSLGADIINYSYGGTTVGYDTTDWGRGVRYARDHGVLVVACAHNGGVNDVTYPAKYAADYDNVICVSATDSYDQYCQWSNYGSAVTVSAPGGAETTNPEDWQKTILSSWPRYEDSDLSLYSLGYYPGDPDPTRRSYGYVDGTSFATPIVSGIAGLILSRWPTKTPAQVREIIEKSAEDLGDAGWDAHYGHGRVNAGYAIAPPDHPSGLYCTGGQDEHPTLHWTAPDAPDVASYHGYKVKRVVDGSIVDYFWVSGTSTSWTDTQIYIDHNNPLNHVTYRV